eukprot:CAMPEP_0197183882 /NCGR_PEP_ID=MMETSP1423-20130617/8675_1 /TAXON_ID=476441 /ORGANISM="Pseudo-nitzschia heimii, Strain UNC1101" /LENGTH=234 /DNA_ID=CAMNT_0042634541 /DNA_START=94 /DNA_END=798 /DNA_ORIENTATION=-
MTKSSMLLAAAALAGTANAFAPPASSRANSRLYEDAAVSAEVLEAPEVPVEPEVVEELFCRGYVGGEGPEPIPFAGIKQTSVNWDPLDFAGRSPEWVPWYREAELKHGRAAMLATVGFVVPNFFRIPGEQFSFESVPKVIDAHDALANTSMIQIFGWISFVEACTFPALANMNEFDRAPGDYGFDPLGLKPQSPEKLKEYQLAELKNGRLAMIAIGGMVAGAAVSGNGFPYLPL